MQGYRIAFVITSAVSFNTLMRGQLEYLRDAGADIDLYCGGPEDEVARVRERGVGHVRHVPFHRQPNPGWDLVCLLWLLALLGVRRYDTIVYSTPKAMLLGSLAAFFTGQPRRIAMVRGRGYENFKGLKRRIYVALDRLTFRISHRVLFVSRSLMDACAGDGIELGHKGQVLAHGSSNGVDLNRFHPLADSARRALREQLGLSPDDFVISVVGRIRDYKGTREVLDLAERLRDVPNLRILIIGPIEEEAMRLEIEAADDAKVRWFAPSAEVERYFQVSDLHLFLSHREGFGNVAIEAAACGVPTFAFDVVGIRDSVIDGVTGRLFAFGDLASIEADIRAAVTERSRLDRFSGARAAVAERFSQPAVWRGYAAIFLDHGDSVAAAMPQAPAQGAAKAFD